MTTHVFKSPFVDVFGATKRVFDRAVQPLFEARQIAATSDASMLDRRALGDIGFDRIDFNTDTGAAIQSALIKICEW
ncbi:MAG: hypothetical protein WBC93_12560 [Sulfitobacter sp.]